MSLPIQNHTKPCLLDEEYVRWFADKTLWMDDRGVYFFVDGRKFYVHDQVMVIACADGSKEPLPEPQMRQFVRARCMPDVRNFYFGSSRSGRGRSGSGRAR